MIGKRDLLFEIGVEELPAGYIRTGLESLCKYLSTTLSRERLTHAEMRTYSTPRRLTVLIQALAEKQEDEVVEKVGPAVRIAYNEKGNLTKAGEGFLRSAGVDKEQLEIKKTDKGEYITARVHNRGEESLKILPALLKEAIRKISFPKTMYWNSRQITFARPIRWLVALFGNEIIEFDLDGLKTGRITYGNILDRKGESITLDNPDRYLELLEEKFVIADRERRKQLIREQLDRLAASLNSRIDYSDNLLEEVTDIVEFPTAVTADYDVKYLKLPERIIHSTLATNQKYFPLYSREDRKLQNSFIFVANNHPNYAENTIEGNRRVVKARLDDAVFYFEEDLERSIDYFNEKLKKTGFHASLGSISDKVERIVKLADFLTERLHIDRELSDKVLRAAAICKFDLVTSMIAEKEFAGLQGYVGMNYALHFGEDPVVATAIEEHYHPLSFYDDIPSSVTGKIVAMADKIDTLCGIFGIGNLPTGSNDPFALRRAGNGVIRILYEEELQVNLPELINYTYSLLNERLPEPDNNKSELNSFFRQRIEWLLEQNKIDYDIVNAVIAADIDYIPLVKQRVEALQKFRKRGDFEGLILSFKRVSNIIARSSELANVDAGLLQEQEEKQLYQDLIELEKRAEPLLEKRNFQALLDLFISLKERIDLFFDHVLVNVEEENLRLNRYALLNRIKTLFLQVGDLSEVVIEGEKEQ